MDLCQAAGSKVRGARSVGAFTQQAAVAGLLAAHAGGGDSQPDGEPVVGEASEAEQ